MRTGSLPVAFFLPICFLCPVPSDVGSLARKTFILRCEGCVRAPVGKQVTGLPVGAGCTEALLLIGGLLAASSRDLDTEFRGETYPLSSVWSETPSLIFLLGILPQLD